MTYDLSFLSLSFASPMPPDVREVNRPPITRTLTRSLSHITHFPNPKVFPSSRTTTSTTMASVNGTASTGANGSQIQPDSAPDLSTISASQPAEENTPLLPGKERYSIFSPAQKTFIIFTAAFASTFSPFSSNIYYPAINSIAKDLHVNAAMINLTITAYMVRYPLLLSH